MSLLVVGSVAYDGLETPHGKVDRILGGAATYIALAASHFTQPRIVAVVGDDFAPEDEALLVRRGVDLTGLERVPGKCFFWQGVYAADMNSRTTLRTDLNVFAGFDPKVPDTYRDSAFVLLGNIQPALQASVRAQVASPRFVGGDTMNFWINDFREELLKTIAEWDLLMINDSESVELSGETNLRKAAARIHEMGPRWVVIKRGEYGAVLFEKGTGHFAAPGYLLDQVKDPTGAGDCFAGGFFGYLAEAQARSGDAPLSGESLRRAVIYGSVLGSFCCEEFGPRRFETLTRQEIDARYEEFVAFTRFA
ncbi:MAG: PfkB family carbohydrate kinase [Bryobacterales bacterium]|nr:PfkB family carbohydrate kinase [Bryobacterales bacterium]